MREQFTWPHLTSTIPMIDPQTGELTLSRTIRIKPGDSLDWLTNLNLGERQELMDMKTGWKWLTFTNVLVEPDYFVLTLGCYNHLLKTVYLSVSENRFNQHRDWSSWSESSELERLVKLQQWLRKEVGLKNQFTWGTAEASYDRKGGSSSIVLRYQ